MRDIKTIALKNVQKALDLAKERLKWADAHGREQDVLRERDLIMQLIEQRKIMNHGRQEA